MAHGTMNTCMASKRLRIPKLLFDHARGWHVRFTNNGKDDRFQFNLPKEDSPDIRRRATNQWRMWVIRQYPAALRLPQFADLAELVKTTPELLRPTAETDPRVRDATLLPLVRRFLETEKARVRQAETASRVATISPKQYDVVRNAVMLIASWATQHYGRRLAVNAWADLANLADYKTMMTHFAQAPHQGRTGYSPHTLGRIHRQFWRLADFSEDDCRRPLQFTIQQAVRAVPFACKRRRRTRTFPDLGTLKRLLAFATETQRAWIWISLGCGFEPIALAQATPACFDEQMYDLTRSKTGLMRRGRMRPLVWAILQKYLREHPRETHDLLFRTEEGNPLIHRGLKSEAARKQHLTLAADNNSVVQAWEKLRKRSRVACEGLGVMRHIACTVMLNRPNVSLQDVREFLGHAPRSDTWAIYGQYRTPTTKPMLQWVEEMLECPDPDGWRDEVVREHEREAEQAEAARRASKWVDCPYCGKKIGNLGRHLHAKHQQGSTPID